MMKITFLLVSVMKRVNNTNQIQKSTVLELEWKTYSLKEIPIFTNRKPCERG